MKKLILIASMSLFASAAMAQNASPSDGSRVSENHTGIQLPDKLHNMWYDEFHEIEGTYYLSNGKKMQLSLSGDRMYATVDGVERTRLVAESPYVFVGRDQKMRMSINSPDANAPFTADILMAVAATTAGTHEEKFERFLAIR